MIKLYLMALAAGLMSVVGLGVTAYVGFETQDIGTTLAVFVGFAFVVAFLKPER